MARAPSDDEIAWLPSRFNVCTQQSDGTLLIYNSFMGAFARVSDTEAAEVRQALALGLLGMPTGILAELCLNGFFVLSGTDELAHVDQLCMKEHVAAQEQLQLVLLPNEQCNFRCKYCAQTFARKKMGRDVIEGVVAHVRARAPTLRSLSVGWFGGEPLTAPEIIDEIAGRLQCICQDHGVAYSSSITTNGYLLTEPVASMLLRREVRGYQITLDGSREHHDRLRVLGDGHTGTFDRIFANLRMLRALDEQFKVVLRVNFDRCSVPFMDPFLDMLEAEFAHDERFCTDFHPVGRWGGPNDPQLAVCGANEGQFNSVDLGRRAISRGLDPAGVREKLLPGGSKCYAAKPYSFVIGSDGTVYKCTVAFEDPRNHVGRMTANGELILDAAKHELWIAQGADKDSGCRSCFFSPSCQGNACPLHRMDTGARPCPTVKTQIEGAMRAVAAGPRPRVSHSSRRCQHATS
jgi:uncharacterized protein